MQGRNAGQTGKVQDDTFSKRGCSEKDQEIIGVGNEIWQGEGQSADENETCWGIIFIPKLALGCVFCVQRDYILNFCSGCCDLYDTVAHLNDISI